MVASATGREVRREVITPTRHSAVGVGLNVVEVAAFDRAGAVPGKTQWWSRSVDLPGDPVGILQESTGWWPARSITGRTITDVFARLSQSLTCSTEIGVRVFPNLPTV